MKGLPEANISIIFQGYLCGNSLTNTRTPLMKNFTKILGSFALILFVLSSCETESESTPASPGENVALTGETSYSGFIGTSVDLTVKLEGASSAATLTADGNAVTIGSDGTATYTVDIASDQDLVGSTITTTFIVTDAASSAEFDVAVEVAPKPLEDSVVPESVFAINPEFEGTIDLQMIMTSQDILHSDSSFVFGSYTDGAALYPNGDGTFAFINNLERDFSVARIMMNADLQPLTGEYILSSTATAATAMCSGSSITDDEHGFGPFYLSGGEWGGDNKGVYLLDPFKDAANRDQAERLSAFGEWATENAVVIGKDAYSDKTVAFIGDDDSNNTYPEGHLGMYVGDRGDLQTGNLYVLKGKNPVETAPGEGGQLFEMGMAEGVEYDVEWVEMTERTIDELNQEAIDANVIGFQRIEDIDWRRGDGAAQRTVYFAVTGRYRADNPDLANRGTTLGRIYKLELNANDPTGDAKITCVLDGDKEGGMADGFHSPDNILVTENYAYIQEDPNGYFDLNSSITGWAKLYQYNLNTGEMKTVLECDEDNNALYGGGGKWEITGLIDVTNIIGASEPTFIGGVHAHGWEQDKIAEAVRADGSVFNDPTAIPVGDSDLEGSFLFKITGLPQ